MIRRFTARDIEFLRQHQLGVYSKCGELISGVEPNASNVECDFCNESAGVGVNIGVDSGTIVVSLDDDALPTQRNPEPAEVSS